MKTMSKYEREILDEIRELPEESQRKIARAVHFFKTEIVSNRISEERATKEMLSVCGKWEDDRSIEQQLEDIHFSRKSTDRTGSSF